MDFCHDIQDARESLDVVRNELRKCNNLFEKEFQAIDMLLLRMICQYKEYEGYDKEDILKLIDLTLPNLLKEL